MADDYFLALQRQRNVANTDDSIFQVILKMTPPNFRCADSLAFRCSITLPHYQLAAITFRKPHKTKTYGLRGITLMMYSKQGKQSYSHL